MGYAEEHFSRLEKLGLTTNTEIAAWLAGPNRKASSYSNYAVQLQEPFAIREEIQRTDDYEELKRLKGESENTLVVDSRTVDMANTKMQKVSKELAKITEKRRQERLKQEKAEREKAHEERMAAQARAKEERIARELAEKQLADIRAQEEREAKRQAANQVRLDALARKEEVRRIARELEISQRELRLNQEAQNV